MWSGLKRLPEERGFTLLEFMVAMILLTVIVMSFAGLINNGVMLSQYNKQEATAMSLAQDKMEEIKAAWPSNESDFNDKVATDLNNQVLANGITYQRLWQAEQVEKVENAPVAAPHYLFKVVVTVSWQYKGTPRSVSLLTYVTGR